MSLPPITIPDLDPAGPIDPTNDLLLIRQGLNDKKVTVDQVAKLNMASFPSLPAEILSTDKIIVGRNNGLGGYTNYIADPRRLGFLKGVIMWFYTDLANVPLNWTNVPSLGDKVLAVKGGTQAYVNQGVQGTWQQTNTTLTIAQIPPHTHSFSLYEATSSNNTGKVGPGKNNVKDTIVTSSTGGGQGHNHGLTWRPAAAVGLVCQKSG